jgi:hypothetical protein
MYRANQLIIVRRHEVDAYELEVLGSNLGWDSELLSLYLTWRPLVPLASSPDLSFRRPVFEVSILLGRFGA